MKIQDIAQSFRPPRPCLDFFQKLHWNDLLKSNDFSIVWPKILVNFTLNCLTKSYKTHWAEYHKKLEKQRFWDDLQQGPRINVGNVLRKWKCTCHSSVQGITYHKNWQRWWEELWSEFTGLARVLEASLQLLYISLSSLLNRTESCKFTLHMSPIGLWVKKRSARYLCFLCPQKQMIQRTATLRAFPPVGGKLTSTPPTLPRPLYISLYSFGESHPPRYLPAPKSPMSPCHPLSL